MCGIGGNGESSAAGGGLVNCAGGGAGRFADAALAAEEVKRYFQASISTLAV
jgi:hypothetical protein